MTVWTPDRLRRALSDVGVLRFCFDCDAVFDLYDAGEVEITPVDDNFDAVDVRLVVV